MKSNYKNLYGLHLAVLLFGFAGLFSKFISESSLIIVWGRVFFASIILYLILIKKKKKVFDFDKKDLWAILFFGLILLFHWWSFFESIRVSSVAIGLITYSTYPVFVSIFEPIVFREKLETKNVIYAFIALCGVILIIPEVNFDNDIFYGAVLGILSGLSFAVLALANRKYIKKYSGLKIAFLQDLSAAAVLTIFLIPDIIQIQSGNFFYLVLLGFVFTALAHVLYINSFKSVSAFNISVVSTLEPVYGIIAAIFLLAEYPELKTIVGGLIILTTALLASFNSIKK